MWGMEKGAHLYAWFSTGARAVCREKVKTICAASIYRVFCNLSRTTLLQVEMPGEPKFKKFDDWQKKATIYYNSFVNAKVCSVCKICVLV